MPHWRSATLLNFLNGNVWKLVHYYKMIESIQYSIWRMKSQQKSENLLFYFNCRSMVNVSELRMCKPDTKHQTPLSAQCAHLMCIFHCFRIVSELVYNFKSNNSISTSISSIQTRLADCCCVEKNYLMRNLMATWDNYLMRIHLYGLFNIFGEAQNPLLFLFVISKCSHCDRSKNDVYFVCVMYVMSTKKRKKLKEHQMCEGV